VVTTHGIAVTHAGLRPVPARAAIGLPLGISDPTLTVGQTPVRALHFGELRAGVD